MSLKNKILALCLIVVGILILYFAINDQKKKQTLVDNEKFSSDIDTEASENRTNEEKSKPVKYHDVFKEPEPVQSRMEKITDQLQIEKLDRESAEIIEKAEALMKKHNIAGETNIPPKNSEYNKSDEIESLEKKLYQLKENKN